MMMSHQIMNNDRSYGGGGGGGGGGIGSGPFHHSSNASVVSSASHNRRGGGHNSGFNNTNNATHVNMIPPPMAIYLKTSHALPLPGVRTSSSSSGSGSGGGSSSKNSMTLACSGRVAIVAVTNAFYAVPSFLDVNVIKSIVSGDYLTSSSATNVSTSTASLPNVTATKIISFAQSSQVHPVIAMEVITSGGGSSDHHHLPATASSSSSTSLDMMKRYFRPITSLVFLASGRDTPIISSSSTHQIFAQHLSSLSKRSSY